MAAQHWLEGTSLLTSDDDYQFFRALATHRFYCPTLSHVPVSDNKNVGFSAHLKYLPLEFRASVTDLTVQFLGTKLSNRLRRQLETKRLNVTIQKFTSPRKLCEQELPSHAFCVLPGSYRTAGNSRAPRP